MESVQVLSPKVSKSYKEELRRKILHASYAEFCRRGFHKTSLDDVAKSLGIARGTIYLYFDSKQDILETISKDMLERFSKIVARHDWTSADFLSTTRSFYRQTKHDLPKESANMTLELMAESTRNPKLKKQRLLESRRMQQIIVDLITSQLRRELPDNTEIKKIALGSIALYNGMEMQRVLGYSEKEIEDSWASTLALILEGLIYRLRSNVKNERLRSKDPVSVKAS